MNVSTFMQYLLDNEAAFSAFSIVQTMFISLCISFGIFLTYKFTYKGVVYSKNFNVSLIMLTLITSIVIMVIGSNIALSLGMVGALSIVRFRTAIKDPRDTAYIFWAIAVGLCSGTGSYMIAAISSIFIMLVLFILAITVKRDDKYLIVIRANISCEEKIQKEVFKSLKNYKLRAKNTAGESLEMICEIRLKENEDITLMQSLYEIEGVKSVNMVAQTGEMIG